MRVPEVAKRLIAVAVFVLLVLFMLNPAIVPWLYFWQEPTTPTTTILSDLVCVEWVRDPHNGLECARVGSRP